MTKKFICLLLGLSMVFCFLTGCNADSIHEENSVITETDLTGRTFTGKIVVDVNFSYINEYKNYVAFNGLCLAIDLNSSTDSFLDKETGNNDFDTSSFEEYKTEHPDCVFTITDADSVNLKSLTDQYKTNTHTNLEFPFSVTIPESFAGEEIKTRAYILGTEDGAGLTCTPKFEIVPKIEEPDPEPDPEPIVERNTVVIEIGAKTEEKEDNPEESNPNTGAPVFAKTGED